MAIYRRNVYLRTVSTARLGIKTANETILSDIKTRAGNHFSRFRLIKGRLISRVNTNARVIALSQLHLLYQPRNNRVLLIPSRTVNTVCGYTRVNSKDKLFVHAHINTKLVA